MNKMRIVFRYFDPHASDDQMRSPKKTATKEREIRRNKRREFMQV